jgi:PAS domain S-box-containing protein
VLTGQRTDTHAASQADLRRVLDTLARFVALTTIDGVILDINEASLRLLRCSRDEVVGRRIAELELWRDDPATVGALQGALIRASAGETPRLDLAASLPDGRGIVLDLQIAPLRDETGRVTQLVPSAVDVTERRTIESDLREREERFRATFDVAAVGLAHVDLDGRWTRVNDGLCGILGYSRDELLGMRFADVTHPDDLAVDLALTAQLIDGSRDSYTLEKRYVRADASVVWAELQVSVVRDALGSARYFVAAIRDVTQRREAESTIRRQLAEIEAIYRSTPIGLAVLDTNLRFVRINERLAEMNGLPVEAHIGRTIGEVVPALADEAEPAMRRVLETGEPLVGMEITGQTPAEPGVSRTWIESWIPVRGRRDEIIGISVTAEEITARRRVEQLRDTFIGMLSHELRTPMTSLYAASQLLRRRDADTVADSGREMDLVEEVVAGAERLQRIVENLLVLARVERGVAMPGADPVLLQRVLPGVVSAERRLWPEHLIDLAPLPANLPPVRSDTDALVQVIRNLVSNAAKYGPPDGRIVINVDRPTPDIVCLQVADEGPGLAEADRERLFDLYYRAADASKRAAGAGIGLFVSRALVEGMGGTLTASNGETVGAVFRVCLPVFTED